MNQAVVVHFQWIPNIKKEIMEELFNSKKYFGASFPPVLFDKTLKTKDGKDILGRVYPDDNYYPNWAIKIFQKNKDNPFITKFQEGYLHYCEGCFQEFLEDGGREVENAVPDPWHEIDYYCKHVPKSSEGKRELIESGKNLMKKFVGDPDGYCPPQHYSSKKTLEIVMEPESGYDFFIVRNLTGLPVWKKNDLIILPCAEIGEKYTETSPVVYTYYNHLVEKEDVRKEFFKLLNSSVPFSELPVSKKPRVKVLINKGALTLRKRTRDWKKKIKKD